MADANIHDTVEARTADGSTRRVQLVALDDGRYVDRGHIPIVNNDQHQAIREMAVGHRSRQLSLIHI